MLARALDDAEVHFLIAGVRDVEPLPETPEILEVREALRLADLKCRQRGGRLILLGDMQIWGDAGFPVLGSEAGAMLAIQLRETIQAGRKKKMIAKLLPEYLMHAGASFFVRAGSALLQDPENRTEWQDEFEFGLRQIIALPAELRPTVDDARSIMNVLTELTLLHPTFAVQFVREFRALYERIRPSIFMDLARATDFPN
ncbi:MAG: hypothetical protein NXI24_23030 [bacterium]|nr:hypothetical protein [bacterium]